MKIKHIITPAVIAICCCLNVYSVTPDHYPAGIGKTAKFIPIVKYNPSNFIEDVKASFTFDKNRECYFYDPTIKEAYMEAKDIKELFQFDKDRNTFVYDSTKRQSPLMAYFKKPDPRRSDLKVIPLHSDLTPIQLELLNTVDSVFSFYSGIITVVSPRPGRALGYLRNGEIRIVDSEETLTLPGYIKKHYSSLQNFIQLYTQNIENDFYKKGSGLYQIESDEEAIAILRNSYFFRLLDNGDAEEVSNMLLGTIIKRIITTEAQNESLRRVVAAAVKNREGIIGKFLGSGDANILSKTHKENVRLWVPYQGNFCEQEREIIQAWLKEESRETYYAYARLRSQLSNVDSEGRFLSDRDELKLIIDRVR